MPEALACFFVISFSLAFIVYARVEGRRASVREPAEERRRAGHNIAWLEEQLARARREGWDDRMVAHLKAQLAEERAGRDRLASRAAS